MRSIFRNKAFVVVAMMITLTVASISWIAHSRSSVQCSATDKTCTINTNKTPSKGNMIWDEIARGLISTISI